MPTTSLNDPIDGAELKAIILHRIAAALDKDCTLVDDIAYAGFRLDWMINIYFKRSNTDKTLIWGKTTEGEEIVADTVTNVRDVYETDSPNEARETHELPIPVMVKTPSGSERRKIHINPPKAKVTT